jgi:hypothetical protein
MATHASQPIVEIIDRYKQDMRRMILCSQWSGVQGTYDPTEYPTHCESVDESIVHFEAAFAFLVRVGDGGKSFVRACLHRPDSDKLCVRHSHNSARKSSASNNWFASI